MTTAAYYYLHKVSVYAYIAFMQTLLENKRLKIVYMILNGRISPYVTSLNCLWYTQESECS